MKAVILTKTILIQQKIKVLTEKRYWAERSLMSQAEIAGGRATSSGELPRKGLLFPNFELISSSEHRIPLSDYRGHSSLVLIFSDRRSETADLLTEVARSYDQFQHQETEIIVITLSAEQECARLKQRLGLPFPCCQTRMAESILRLGPATSEDVLPLPYMLPTVLARSSQLTERAMDIRFPGPARS